jgi:hypothetical protein
MPYPPIDELFYHPVAKEYSSDVSTHPIQKSTSSDMGMWVSDVRPQTAVTVKQSDGWREPTGYERVIQTGWLRGIEVDMAYQCYDSSGTKREFGSHFGPYSMGDRWKPSVPEIPPHLYGRSVNKALSKLKDQKVNLAVAFGERKETAKFVTDTILTGVDVARAIRKKDSKALKKALSLQEKKKRPYNMAPHHSFKEVVDAPSKLVLTNSYAFQPLVGDVYGVLDELNRRDLASPKRYKTGVSVQVREEYNRETLLWLAPSWYGEFEVNQTTRGFRSAKVRLDYYLDNPLLRTLAQLGITNPVSLAYELLPLSFVLDWFLPVGQYLDGLDAAAGMTFRGGSISYLTRMKCSARPTGRVRHWQYSNVKAVRNRVVRNAGRQTRLLRQVFTSSPGPVYPPFADNPWSAPHVSSALALLAQAVQGKSLHYR